MAPKFLDVPLAKVEVSPNAPRSAPEEETPKGYLPRLKSAITGPVEQAWNAPSPENTTGAPPWLFDVLAKVQRAIDLGLGAAPETLIGTAAAALGIDPKAALQAVNDYAPAFFAAEGPIHTATETAKNTRLAPAIGRAAESTGTAARRALERTGIATPKAASAEPAGNLVPAVSPERKPVAGTAARPAAAPVQEARGPGAPVKSLPAINERSLRLLSEEHQLVDMDRQLGEFLDGLEVSKGAEAAQTKISRLDEIDRQLKQSNLTAKDKAALNDRRDQLLADTNPETLRETAAPLRMRQQATEQRRRIFERLAEIRQERQAQRSATATPPLPKMGPPELPARAPAEAGSKAPPAESAAPPSKTATTPPAQGTAPGKRVAGTASLRRPVAGAAAPKPARIVSDDAVNAARARLRAKSGRLSAGVDPQDFIDLATIGAYHIETGARTFAQFSKKMIEERGDQIRPQLKRLYAAAQQRVRRGTSEQIAPEGPLSRPAAVENPRELEDQLFQLGGNRTADAIEATQRLKELPPGVKPETWEKLYHHEEDPTGVPLTPEEQRLYDEHVAPIAKEADQLSRELEELGVPLEEHGKTVEGSSPEERRGAGYTPRYVAGRTRSLGETLERWKQGVEARFGVGGGARSLRKTVDAQKSRRFYNAVNPDTGEKTVVHVGTDGTVRAFDGSAKPRDLGQLVKGQKLAPGAKIRVGDDTWTLQGATTKEIEAAAATRYHKNLMANRLDNLLSLRRAVRNARFIKEMTESPAWGRVAVKAEGTSVPPKSGGRVWRRPKLPQFSQWYVEPRLADALDDFARDMSSNEGVEDALNKIGRVMNFFMFINPKAHIDNVLNHMMVDRGLVGNVIYAPRTIRNLLRATKSVLTADPEYVRALRAGMSLPYARFLSSDLHAQLIKSLGKAADANPKAWDRLASILKYRNAKEMLRRIGQAPSRTLWAASDIMAMSRLYDLKSRGMDIEHAFKTLEKGLPNYRVPGQIAGSRFLSQLFGNPAWGRFGRYQYGRLAAYFHALRDAFGPGRNLGERGAALDRMAMMGVYMMILYPAFDAAWRAVTGNPNAKTVRSGTSSIPQAVIDVFKGDKAIGDLLPSIFTQGIPLEMAPEIYSGRYQWSGEPIARNADVWAGRWNQVFEDLGSYALSKLSMPGQLLSPESTETAGQVGLHALGVLSPTEDQMERREAWKERDARSAARRAARFGNE